MKTNKQTRIWKYITLFKSARVILLGGGRCGKTVVFTGSRQETGSFSPVIAHHCLLEMIERRIREKRIIRKGGGWARVDERGDVEGKEKGKVGVPEGAGETSSIGR